MSTPRVAVLLRDFRGGGAERSMINIATGLAGKGVAVDLVVFQESGPFRRYVTDDIRVVSLAAPLKGLLTSIASLKMAAYLRRFRPQRVLSTLEATTLVACMARRLSGAPVDLVIRVATTFAKDRRRLARGALIRRVYGSHRGVFVANSNGSADHFAKALGFDRRRIQVIYNAIDTSLIDAMAAEPLDHAGPFANGARVVLGVGRLTQAKRFDLLLRAFARVDPGLGLNLLILGEGRLRPELERLARDLGLSQRVFMPGFATNPYPYMRRASAVALSSDYEGMPNVILEALACGCPVVATDCPAGPHEVLEGGRWGDLVPIGDAEALAAGIERAVLQPRHPEALRNRARGFSVARAADAYYQVLFGQPLGRGVEALHATASTDLSWHRLGPHQ